MHEDSELYHVDCEKWESIHDSPFIFSKGKFNLPDSLSQQTHHGIRLFEARLDYDVMISLTALSDGSSLEINGSIDKIQYWFFKTELTDKPFILQSVIYTSLKPGHTVEDLLMWNSLLHRDSKLKKYDPAFVIFGGFNESKTNSVMYKKRNDSEYCDLKLSELHDSLLRKFSFPSEAKFFEKGFYKNFPFSFVCLEKHPDDIELQTREMPFEGDLQSSYIRSNPIIKKYFNSLRMFRSTSIGSDAVEPIQFIGNKETEYQQWGSTRYCFSSMGGIILSLATDDHEIPLQVNKKDMVYWFDSMYVPLLVINIYYKSFLIYYSKELEVQNDVGADSKMLIKHHNVFLKFMKEHWFYHLTDNVQSEGIWESWKRALNIDSIFTGIRTEINELVSMKELQATSKLNMLFQILTFSAISIALFSLFVDIVGLEYVKKAPLTTALICVGLLGLIILSVYFLKMRSFKRKTEL